MTQFTQKSVCTHQMNVCVCVGVFGSEVQQLFFAEQLFHFACNACLLLVSWLTGEHIAGRCAYICLGAASVCSRINEWNVQMKLMWVQFNICTHFLCMCGNKSRQTHIQTVLNLKLKAEQVSSTRYMFIVWGVLYGSRKVCYKYISVLFLNETSLHKHGYLWETHVVFQLFRRTSVGVLIRIWVEGELLISSFRFLGAGAE